VTYRKWRWDIRLGFPLLVPDRGQTTLLERLRGHVSHWSSVQWINPKDSKHILLRKRWRTLQKLRLRADLGSHNTDALSPSLTRSWRQNASPYNIQVACRIMEFGLVIRKWSLPDPGKPTYGVAMEWFVAVILRDHTSSTSDLNWNVFRIDKPNGQRESTTIQVMRRQLLLIRYNWRKPAEHEFTIIRTLYTWVAVCLHKVSSQGSTWKAQSLMIFTKKQAKSEFVSIPTHFLVRNHHWSLVTIYARIRHGNVWVLGQWETGPA